MLMNLSNKNKALLALAAVCVLYFAIDLLFDPRQAEANILTELSAVRSFEIEVHTIGELETMRSTSITSSVKGDLGKIIYLIQDGASVKAGDVLVRMDPTPFEEHIAELKLKIREQKGKIDILERMATWETHQVEHEETAAQIEIDAAKLELNKQIYGDGPIEEARLRSAVQKALAKYNDLRSFAEDLALLEAQDYLNPVELKQAEDRLAEEEENYLSAKLQYETYISHTQPMLIKKGEMTLKKCKNRFDEILKSGAFRIVKAKTQREQAVQELHDLESKLKIAEHQMTLTEIKAPNPGMVVQKEEFRNGQRRKPRLGDVLLRNQPILDLPDLSTMLVKTKVREIDLFKISIGTPATIEVDAYPDLRFEGEITTIGVLAVSDVARTGEEKYFDVIVKLASSDPRLRPGMTAHVVFHASRVSQKWSIPVQAVFEFQKRYYCFAKTEDGIAAIPIEIGSCNELWIEVTSGLSESLPILLSMPPWPAISNSDEIQGAAL